MSNTTFLVLVAATSVVASVAVRAQEQTPQPAPASTAVASAVASPARGSTMEAVRAKFGAPSQEAPAVGKPPITRWEYPGYVVFFENDRVLHTVVVNK